MMLTKFFLPKMSTPNILSARPKFTRKSENLQYTLAFSPATSRSACKC